MKLKNPSKNDVLRSAMYGGCAFVPAHGHGFYKLEMCKELEQEGLLRSCPPPAHLLTALPDLPADTPTFEVTEMGRQAVAEAQAKVTSSFLARVAKYMQTAGVPVVDLTPMSDELRGWLMEETILGHPLRGAAR